jgi:hypothetical protein
MEYISNYKICLLIRHGGSTLFRRKKKLQAMFDWCGKLNQGGLQKACNLYPAVDLDLPTTRSLALPRDLNLTVLVASWVEEHHSLPPCASLPFPVSPDPDPPPAGALAPPCRDLHGRPGPPAASSTSFCSEMALLGRPTLA